MTKCKVCNKPCKDEYVVEACGDFCSIRCAQIDYEDQWLQDELQSENANGDGFEDAIERLV